MLLLKVNQIEYQPLAAKDTRWACRANNEDCLEQNP
jgi:hypothetical protein